MSFVEQGSKRIYYTVDGDGPAVVLIHGVGEGGVGWHRNGYVEAFSANFRTVTLDIRGFGQSSAPESVADVSMASRVQDVEAVLAELGIDRTSVFGFSMGGRIAAAFTAEHPERVRCLVIGSSNPEPMSRNLSMAEGRSFINRFRRLTPRRAVAAAWRRVEPSARRAMRDPQPSPTSMALATTVAGGDAIDRGEMMRRLTVDSDRAAERITMATLLFQGDRDDLFSWRLSQGFTERLARGEFVALHGQPHAILERPQLVLPIVEPFLLSHGRD